jgi:hypothetical protein
MRGADFAPLLIRATKRRRLNVEWSGMARSRPSSAMMDPINPSVCRNAKRNTARSVRAVVIAKLE